MRSKDHLRYLFRRSLQLLLCIPILVISAPLIIIAAIAVKFSSPGPIIYKGKRVGKDREIYTMYKFRTMRVGTEERVGGRLIKRDEEADQITKVGRILRKYKLDELPQLINVIKDEMNFVGPRPMRPALLKSYMKQYPDYTKRFAVKPGITGLAQTRGGYYIHPRRKLRYDLFYIQKQSLWLDVKIIVITFYLVFKKALPKGLYSFLARLRYASLILKKRRTKFEPLYISGLSDESDLVRLAQRHASKAVCEIRKRIRKGGNSASIFYCLGLAHITNNQTASAVGPLQEAIKSDPVHIRARYQLGLVLYRQDQYKEAIKHLKTASELSSEYEDALYLLALCYTALGSSEEAEQFQNKASAINPVFRHQLHVPGQEYLILLGDHALANEVIACLVKEISEKPGNAELYNMLGIVYAQKGMMDDAIQAFSSAIEISPDYIDAMVNMGDCLASNEESQAAIEVFEAVLQKKPDHVHVYIKLGKLYSHQGSEDRAVGAFEEALRINPGLITVKMELEILKHRLGWEGESI